MPFQIQTIFIGELIISSEQFKRQRLKNPFCYKIYQFGGTKSRFKSFMLKVN